MIAVLTEQQHFLNCQAQFNLSSAVWLNFFLYSRPPRPSGKARICFNILKRKTPSLGDDLAGRQPHRKTNSQKDDLTGRRTHGKTTSPEDDFTRRQLHRRQNHRETTLQEDNLTGRQPQRKIFLIFRTVIFVLISRDFIGLSRYFRLWKVICIFTYI